MLRDNITGFVLAGGRSLRMRRDKAHIPWDHGTLLSHAVEEISQVTSRVFIVGALEPPAMALEIRTPLGSGECLSASVLPDKFPGCGPLGGIQAALAHTATDWNLILAVDLPLVTAGLLGFIADHRGKRASLAVVPKVGGKLQPLCASYHPDLLSEVERALTAGELSIHRLLERVSTGIINDSPPASMYVIEEQELEAAGFVPEMLLNVNTPEDLERARALAKTLHV